MSDDRELKEVSIKGLIGTIQRNAHEDLGCAPSFTMGTINFPHELIWGVTNDTASKLEAILKKAREDIMAVLDEELKDG